MEQTLRRTINVVAGLIFRNGQLLVCQRHGSAEFPLKWEFPGGKVEAGETDLDALRRELKEELDIEIRDARLLSRYAHSYKEGPTVSLRFYNVKAFDGEAKNLVFQQISWVKLPDLETLDFLDGDRPIIEQLICGGAAQFLRC